MLRYGPYPVYLKRRILSNRGHLSNADCARLAARLAGNGTKTIILGHLSRENNFPEMAYQTVKNILEDADYYIGNQIQLVTLSRDCISGMCEL